LKFLETLSPLWETAKGIIPLTLILILFQVVILKKPIEDVKKFSTGILLATLGLHMFLKGTNMSLIPLGSSVGKNLHILDSKWIIVILGFVIGYFGTLVEPALKTLALEVEEISVGAISHTVLIHGVAAGFGVGMSIGLFKIVANIPYIKIIIPLLVLVVLLIFFTPEPYISIAMDSASATTGPVNIPLNMALAVGLASIIEGVDPLLSGFGIIGLTSVGAMVSVLILGILTKL
jgi:uncharacterized protein DUF1538